MRLNYTVWVQVPIEAKLAIKTAPYSVINMIKEKIYNITQLIIYYVRLDADLMLMIMNYNLCSKCLTNSDHRYVFYRNFFDKIKIPIGFEFENKMKWGWPS